MNREQFLNYLKNPSSLDNKSLPELTEIVNEYPYFQTAHLLLVKNLHNQENIKFNNQLKISSAYILDRKVLYTLIYEKLVNEVKEAKTAPVIDEPVQTDLLQKDLAYLPTGQAGRPAGIEKPITIIDTATIIEESPIDIHRKDEITERIPEILQSEQTPAEIPVISKEKKSEPIVTAIENPIETVKEEAPVIIINEPVATIENIIVTDNPVIEEHPSESKENFISAEAPADIKIGTNAQEKIGQIQPAETVSPVQIVEKKEEIAEQEIKDEKDKGLADSVMQKILMLQKLKLKELEALEMNASKEFEIKKIERDDSADKEIKQAEEKILEPEQISAIEIPIAKDEPEIEKTTEDKKTRFGDPAKETIADKILRELREKREKQAIISSPIKRKIITEEPKITEPVISAEPVVASEKKETYFIDPEHESLADKILKQVRERREKLEKKEEKAEVDKEFKVEEKLTDPVNKPETQEIPEINIIKQETVTIQTEPVITVIYEEKTEEIISEEVAVSIQPEDLKIQVPEPEFIEEKSLYHDFDKEEYPDTIILKTDHPVEESPVELTEEKLPEKITFEIIEPDIAPITVLEAFIKLPSLDEDEDFVAEPEPGKANLLVDEEVAFTESLPEATTTIHEPDQIPTETRINEDPVITDTSPLMDIAALQALFTDIVNSQLNKLVDEKLDLIHTKNSENIESLLKELKNEVNSFVERSSEARDIITEDLVEFDFTDESETPAGDTLPTGRQAGQAGGRQETEIEFKTEESDESEGLFEFEKSGVVDYFVKENVKTEMKQPLPVIESTVSKYSNLNSDLIDKFLRGEHKIVPAESARSYKEVSKQSIEESEECISETLARIYLKQGHYNKALLAYRKLSLKYPEKSIYFAAQIEKLKKLINE
ncbi:MAG: hypothetical protein HY958_06400 [Bacteroidia bacterium]|nr:hypothetical protein [Bacteroidia bacterium]